MTKPFVGKLVVISAPSGAGKTTIAHRILALNPSLSFSVSATTRPRRGGESGGKDYFFLSPEAFRRQVAAGEFVEWEEIYGNLYGTLNREIERAIREGRHLLFDVDVKGGLSIKRRYPEACLIFIRPPSEEVLLQRLRDRKTEDEQTVSKRMARVPMEMALGEQFDHQVVNEVLDTTVNEAQKIVRRYLDQS
jgi:guanylate kinase